MKYNAVEISYPITDDIPIKTIKKTFKQFKKYKNNWFSIGLLIIDYENKDAFCMFKGTIPETDAELLTECGFNVKNIEDGFKTDSYYELWLVNILCRTPLLMSIISAIIMKDRKSRGFKF
jgi:hypothetical protein